MEGKLATSADETVESRGPAKAKPGIPQMSESAMPSMEVNINALRKLSQEDSYTAKNGPG